MHRDIARALALGAAAWLGSLSIVASSLAQDARGPLWAVVRITAVRGECSGAGGLHLVGEIVESSRPTTLRTVHLGGHARDLPELDVGRPLDEPVFGPPFFVVVRLDEASAPRRVAPPPGWCVDDLPIADVHAEPVARVRSVAEGRALIAREARRPAPRGPR